MCDKKGIMKYQKVLDRFSTFGYNGPDGKVRQEADREGQNKGKNNNSITAKEEAEAGFRRGGQKFLVLCRDLEQVKEDI